MKIFPTASIKRIDAYTIEHEPISSLMLMERAATVLTKAILKRYSSSFAIFAGPGNNGGDALAIARMLVAAGRRVRVWLFSSSSGRLSPDCDANLRSLQLVDSDLLEINIVEDSFIVPTVLPEAVVIDGLFGSGLTRPLEGIYANVVHFINAIPNRVVSIDIPSGLMGEDNSCNVYENIVKADITYTLQFPKLAMFFAENAPFVGEFEVLDICLSHEAMDREKPLCSMITKDSFSMLATKRNRHAHKGMFGRALLVAGSKGMAGASILSARATLRSGVGLLTLYIPNCNNRILQCAVPEAMTICDCCENNISASPSVEKYNAIAVGPGLGQHPDSERALLSLIGNCHVPMVVDADALNILARNKEYLSRLPAGSIITPHIGEFTRLAGECASSYERLQRALDMAADNNIYIVLKGAYTAVVTPDRHYFLNTSGNAGMATGGSGDVLTGILLALLARGFSSEEAARLGVFIHGTAGDIAASRLGETSLIAGDIVDALPQAWESLGK